MDAIMSSDVATAQTAHTAVATLFADLRPTQQKTDADAKLSFNLPLPPGASLTTPVSGHSMIGTERMFSLV